MNDNMKNKLGDWWPVLKPIFDSQRFMTLRQALKQEYASGHVYPSPGNVFRAFELTQFHDLRVVILGQDPYHNGIATGLAFATNNGSMSPSLRHIVKELYDSYGVDVDKNFDTSLEHWARQGVLLLNTSLTVREKSPNSHKKIWDGFTLQVIKRIIANHKNIVFVAWGKDAANLMTKAMIPKEEPLSMSLFPEEAEASHYLLTAPHPAAEAYSGGKAGFFGCNHFLKINQYLEDPIDFLNTIKDERRHLVPG
jgi:uracil-DNA glycosylase